MLIYCGAYFWCALTGVLTMWKAIEVAAIFAKDSDEDDNDNSCENDLISEIKLDTGGKTTRSFSRKNKNSGSRLSAEMNNEDKELNNEDDSISEIKPDSITKSSVSRKTTRSVSREKKSSGSQLVAETNNEEDGHLSSPKVRVCLRRGKSKKYACHKKLMRCGGEEKENNCPDDSNLDSNPSKRVKSDSGKTKKAASRRILTKTIKTQIVECLSSLNPTAIATLSISEVSNSLPDHKDHLKKFVKTLFHLPQPSM